MIVGTPVIPNWNNSNNKKQSRIRIQKIRQIVILLFIRTNACVNKLGYMQCISQTEEFQITYVDTPPKGSGA